MNTKPSQLAKDLRTFLIAERKRKGITQLDIAVATGMAPNTLSDFERGKIVPRLEIIEAYAMAMKISLTVILDSKNELPVSFPSIIQPK